MSKEIPDIQLDPTHDRGRAALHGRVSEGENERALAPEDDPLTQDPPDWIVQQASLSELLLWRLGIPVDREAIERQHHAARSAVDLKPPITTRKVADAIASLSMQLMEGKIDPDAAKTSLYALQTLLTALRLQIVEEKKSKDARKKSPRRRKHAASKR